MYEANAKAFFPQHEGSAKKNSGNGRSEENIFLSHVMRSSVNFYVLPGAIVLATLSGLQSISDWQQTLNGMGSSCKIAERIILDLNFNPVAFASVNN